MPALCLAPQAHPMNLSHKLEGEYPTRLIVPAAPYPVISLVVEPVLVLAPEAPIVPVGTSELC